MVAIPNWSYCFIHILLYFPPTQPALGHRCQTPVPDYVSFIPLLNRRNQKSLSFPALLRSFEIIYWFHHINDINRLLDYIYDIVKTLVCHRCLVQRVLID